ncbi:putative malonyl-CoA decarboxylase [Helianthus annuus]|nr:putative malonyl-CoA decarboxylase [Helianthus annuus]
MEVLLHLLTSTNHEWTRSDRLITVLEPILLRLCARYLVLEKKRGKALDSVANFHLQNGAMIGRLNWMADRSEKGLSQSGGIMVNYIYSLEHIEDYAQAYFSTGHIQASPDVHHHIQVYLTYHTNLSLSLSLTHTHTPINRCFVY